MSNKKHCGHDPTSPRNAPSTLSGCLSIQVQASPLSSVFSYLIHLTKQTTHILVSDSLCRHKDQMHPEIPSSKTRKRGRDDDDDENSLHGFSEHRRIIKARDNTRRSSIAVDLISQNQVTSSLAIRPSANSPPRARSNAMSHPRPAEITPNGSDNEDLPNVSWTKPYSSLQSTRYYPNEPISSQSSLPEWPNSSQVLDSQEVQEHDSMDIDEEMGDGPQFSQTSQHDSLFSHSGRISTPINSHFSSVVRSRNHNYGLPIEEATSRLKNDRRLPSPISEDESSPSIQLSGVAEMQMEIEPQETPKECQEKRNSRTKLGVRNWGHVPTGMAEGEGGAKKLSMGYRNDCEKCRQKVPGHYIHLVS